MLRILDKYDKTLHRGYTLAEMLIVLVIVSLIMMALPRATKKLFHVTTKPGENGRMECYYEVTSSGTLQLVNYYEAGSQKKTCKDNGATCATTSFRNVSYAGTTYRGCVFEVPKNAVYMALSGVGGGGAGAWPLATRNSNTSKFFTTPELEYVTRSSTISKTPNNDRWPQWLKNLYNKNFPSGAATVQKNAIEQMFKDFADDSNRENMEIKVSWQSMKLRYTPSGKAGKLITMYFPQIVGDSTIVAVPGVGGKATNYSASTSVSTSATAQIAKFNGEAGTTTRVFIVSTSGSPIELLKARGGAGGVVFKTDTGDILDAYVSADQPAEKLELADDEGLHNEDVVKLKPSGFVTLISEGAGTASSLLKYYNDHPTYIRPGDGGRGSFNIFNSSESFLKRFYYINDYETVKKQTSPVKQKLTGTKWSNVSSYVKRDYESPSGNGSCTRTRANVVSNASTATFRTTFVGTCTTLPFGGGIQCTVGNSTDIDDSTCGGKMSAARDSAAYPSKYFYINPSTINVHSIPQQTTCAKFQVMGKNTSATPENTLNRCNTHINDGVKDSHGKYVHCTLGNKLGSPYSQDSSNRFYKYNSGSIANTGCYYDNQIGYVDSTTGDIIDRSPTAGRIVCKLPPEPFGQLNYLSCPNKSSAFTCPDGTSSTSICKPSDGGNGAVVLLW